MGADGASARPRSFMTVSGEQAGGLGAVFRREGQNEIDNSYICVFIWSLFS
jgi:hypothetical protein